MSNEIIKDYTRFINHDEQRELRPAHVRKLTSSMKSHGFLKARAITCIRQNGRLLILDGHHRLAAAVALGIPVQVFVSPKAVPLEVLNSLSRNWSLSDCLNSFMTRGNQEYFKLNSYIEKGLPIGKAIALLSGETGRSQNGSRRVRMGTFQVKTTKLADTILGFINDIAPLFSGVRTTNFISALSMALRVPTFSIKTLIAKIKAKPDLLRNASTTAAYLDIIDKAYNYHAVQKIPLAFLAVEEGRERSACANGTKFQLEKAS